MNIYNMYFVSVYTVLDIRYNEKYENCYSTEYTRDAMVLKRKIFNKTYYIDLFTKSIIKTDIHNCDIGDEFIVLTKRYDPVVDYINQFDIKKPNISKKQIIKMLLNNKEGEK